MLTSLYQIIEIIAVCSAAVTGVLAASAVRADIFGAMVLGCTTAFGGGILRDLLLGVTPPAALRNPLMLILAAAVSLTVFALEYAFGDKAAGEVVARESSRHEQIMNMVDALSLSMFVIVGIDAAMAAGYAENAFLTVFVGVVTGVGGGLLRDIMIRRVPVILQKRIYALAAILGAILDVYLTRFGLSQELSAAAAVCFILLIRYLSVHFRWNLPRYPKY
ncbi:MAG: trimeric intracellular cation channel family protein [Ruminococcaceae bacterium]|nr:trimeric intracellular cation channel family protein [Oscillospiraceae bacterium]